MHSRDIILVGASAGGIRALIDVASALPADLPAAIMVVVHTSPGAPGVLPNLLNNAGRLPAAFASDGERIRNGRIYVAPSDRHLLIAEHSIQVSRGPRENGFRPAIDPLFRTAAHFHGPRAIGVVLSGALHDGTLGLKRIKEAGGIAIVQDPEQATHRSMPDSAIAQVQVDYVARVPELAAILAELTRERIEGKKAMAKRRNSQKDIAEVGDRAVTDEFLPGKSSGFVCPECGGALWEVEDGNTLVYRCHVGHSYTESRLIDGSADALEHALWTALRALEENAALNRRLAERMKLRKADVVARSFGEKASDSERRAAAIRGVLLSNGKSAKRKKPVEKPPLVRKVLRQSAKSKRSA